MIFLHPLGNIFAALELLFFSMECVVTPNTIHKFGCVLAVSSHHIFPNLKCDILWNNFQLFRFWKSLALSSSASAKNFHQFTLGNTIYYHFVVLFSHFLDHKQKAIWLKIHRKKKTQMKKKCSFGKHICNEKKYHGQNWPGHFWRYPQK